MKSLALNNILLQYQNLKKDIISTHWHGHGYSGFQAVLTIKHMSNIGDAQDTKLEIEVTIKGTIKNYDFKVPTTDYSRKPTTPDVEPPVKP